jgi:hypothetical protein
VGHVVHSSPPRDLDEDILRRLPHVMSHSCPRLIHRLVRFRLPSHSCRQHHDPSRRLRVEHQSTLGPLFLPSSTAWDNQRWRRPHLVGLLTGCSKLWQLLGTRWGRGRVGSYRSTFNRDAKLQRNRETYRRLAVPVIESTNVWEEVRSCSVDCRGESLSEMPKVRLTQSARDTSFFLS